jgi:hypothetical protein
MLLEADGRVRDISIFESRDLVSGQFTPTARANPYAYFDEAPV